jgi:hypothetical protein
MLTLRTDVIHTSTDAAIHLSDAPLAEDIK